MEPLGRNPQMEALGYLGKQCYWIRCRSCFKVECPVRCSSASVRVEGGVEVAGGEQGKAAVGLGGEAKEPDAAQPEESANESGSESDSEPERERKPEPMPFSEALALLKEHPAAKVAFLERR